MTPESNQPHWIDEAIAEQQSAHEDQHTLTREGTLFIAQLRHQIEGDIEHYRQKTGNIAQLETLGDLQIDLRRNEPSEQRMRIEWIVPKSGDDPRLQVRYEGAAELNFDEPLIRAMGRPAEFYMYSHAEFSKKALKPFLFPGSTTTL